MVHRQYSNFMTGTLFSFAVLCSQGAWANNVLTAAELTAIRNAPESRIVAPGRLQTEPQGVVPNEMPTKMMIPDFDALSKAPKGSKNVNIRFDNIVVEGADNVSSDDIALIYQSYLGKDVPLSTLWDIALEVTRYYRNKGYFLSRAYVPAQEIKNGTVLINVVEGYIDNINFEHSLKGQPVLESLFEEILSHKPLSAAELEELVLRINDIPGLSVRALVEPIKVSNREGAVTLTLKPVEVSGAGSIVVDNYDSRYLGPYKAVASWQESFIPMVDTRLSLGASLEHEEMKYASFYNSLPIAPDWSLNMSGSYVSAAPGSTLEESDINSSSVGFGIGALYQPIRQRQENLSLSVALNGRNSNSNVLSDTPLVRDRIRALRTTLSYDKADSFHGYNFFTLGYDQGLKILGASKENPNSTTNQNNLSRAGATPDFHIFRGSFMRHQALADEWLAIIRSEGQYASGSLYSSEEFGYGGQNAGRAFDLSEITGDHGITGSLEMRYLGAGEYHGLDITPYGFYDVGRVWNEESGDNAQSASSIGFGTRLSHDNGLSMNLGLAWPLIKRIEAPLYGHNRDPRIILQTAYGF